MSQKLTRSFYVRPTLEVAPDLLDCTLCSESSHDFLSARIVEVEAYIGQDDPACHAAPGPTERNKVMFGQAGFSYIYLIYGMYHCFNIVTEIEGFPAAVLIRAAEPRDGIELMRANSPTGPLDRLLSGPGKLCRAFGLTREQNGLDLTKSRLYLTSGEESHGKVVRSQRIGITRGVELQYRFYLAGSEAVSGPAGMRK